MKTLLVLWGAAAMAQTVANPVGHWQGKIQIPDHELSITVDLARDAKSQWIGSMSVTGSTSIDVPLEDIAVDGAAVRFASNLPVHASFDGKLSADGSSFSGTASSAAGDAPFQLTRAGEANVKTPPPSSPLPKEFEGTWEGSVEAGGATRRVALKLSAGADGAASAILVAVDQGNLEIPVTSVTIKDKQLELDVRAISGKYAGALGAGGEIAGEWTQGPVKVALTFRHAGSEPKKP